MIAATTGYFFLPLTQRREILDAILLHILREKELEILINERVIHEADISYARNRLSNLLFERQAKLLNHNGQKPVKQRERNFLNHCRSSF